jgi:hypothetical protein
MQHDLEVIGRLCRSSNLRSLFIVLLAASCASPNLGAAADSGLNATAYRQSSLEERADLTRQLRRAEQDLYEAMGRTDFKRRLPISPLLVREVKALQSNWRPYAEQECETLAYTLNAGGNATADSGLHCDIDLLRTRIKLVRTAIRCINMDQPAEDQVEPCLGSLMPLVKQAGAVAGE